jgi:hypothetical protein
VSKPDEVREIFERLSAPIDAGDIRERVGKGGRMLRYIRAETAMHRLDVAVGPGNWECQVDMAADHVRCRLTIHLPDGRAISRDGIGGYPEPGGGHELSPEDKPKGGATEAFKRACVLFGIARDIADDAPVNAAGGTTRTNWGSPPSQGRPDRTSGGNGQSSGGGNVPRSGKALFAFLKEQEQKGAKDLLKWVNGYLKLQDIGSRIVDLDAEQVAQVHAVALRKIQAMQPAGREPGEDDGPDY